MKSAPIISDLSLYILGFGIPPRWSRAHPLGASGGHYTLLRCDEFVISRYDAAGRHLYTFTIATLPEFERWVAAEWAV